ncbi:LytTR family DNA-binding domain-containing protein [Hymenobacter koreensis]|uniref:LytTR family DNA-binding domain-containing protein n=1 Tax=Hymenobacter koreensis TaxID=1084523 RepID=A0ABP8JLZ6_9BACT
MNVLIIEDEEWSARQTTQFLHDYAPQAQVLAVIKSVEKALDWFARNPMPDLVFSDIELLDGNVFTLYSQVSITCPIIFATAYDQFLLQAFKVNGIAYLLKPFDAEQFKITLDKYDALRTNFTQPSAAPATGLNEAVVQELSRALQQNSRSFKQRFSVRMRNSLYILSVDDVMYLQADEGVVFATDKQAARYPLAGTLTDLERQLDPDRFFRINRSELVNISYVEKIEPYFNNRLSVKMKNADTALVTSTAHTPEFRKWLEG